MSGDNSDGKTFISSATHYAAFGRPLLYQLRDRQDDDAEVGCYDKIDTAANRKLRDDGGNPWSDLERYYPIPKLTKCTDFSLKPNYVSPGLLGGGFLHWSDEAKRRVDRAVVLMNAVWSSQEFKDAVTHAPLLWWKYRAKELAQWQILGNDLYPKLISNPTPTVNYTIRFGSAAAQSAGNTTYFRVGYLGKANPYQLCNTISHEYTHLRDGGESLDRGYDKQPDTSIFVSYGVGVLTEKLAAEEQLYGCDLTPRPARNRSKPVIGSGT